jgi:hypothetical protein
MSDKCAACGVAGTKGGTLLYGLCFACMETGAQWAAKMARINAGGVSKSLMRRIAAQTPAPESEKPVSSIPLPCPWCGKQPEVLSGGEIYCNTRGCPAWRNCCFDVERWNRRNG